MDTTRKHFLILALLFSATHKIGWKCALRETFTKTPRRRFSNCSLVNVCVSRLIGTAGYYRLNIITHQADININIAKQLVLAIWSGGKGKQNKHLTNWKKWLHKVENNKKFALFAGNEKLKLFSMTNRILSPHCSSCMFGQTLDKLHSLLSALFSGLTRNFGGGGGGANICGQSGWEFGLCECVIYEHHQKSQLNSLLYCAKTECLD